MPRSTPSARSVFTLSVLALAVLGVAPSRYTGWARSLRNPLEVVVNPASQPFATLSTWLRPGAPTHDEREVEVLRAEHDQYKYLYLRAADQVDEMKRLYQELHAGVGDVRRVEARRLGSDPGEGTMEFGRGSTDGVEAQDSVAVVRDYEQLLGPVVRVGANSCTARLMTDRNLRPRLIECRVMPDDPRALQGDPSALPRCQLAPLGDDTLASVDLGVETAQRISVGQEVRAADPSWPAARMLVVGKVAKITDADTPLFKRLIVTPVVDLARVRSVLIQSLNTDVPQPRPDSAAAPTQAAHPPATGAKR